MAKKTNALTNTQVKQAKSKEKVYKLLDGDCLQLRIMPTGAKQWLLDYLKPVTKKRTSLSLGNYPAVSLAEARQKRVDAKELLAKGIDPKEHRDDIHRELLLASSHTLKKVATEWFEIKKTNIAETTAISLWRCLNNHVFPKLANRPIDKLLAPEVIKTLKPLAAKGSLETTSKLISYLNAIMKHAVNTGILHHNPLTGIGSAFETPKVTHMPTLKPEELPELMHVLGYASIKLITRFLIEFELHTMVRPGEASGARWCEIDFDKSLWVIPAERMKMKIMQIVPLTSQSLKILSMVNVISGDGEYIFPADRKPKKACGSQTANKALERMGFKGRLVAHGMRSIASTTLNEEGFNKDVVECALSHQDEDEVRKAYNHAIYLVPRREMMTWWSQRIEDASTGKYLGNQQKVAQE